MFAVLTRARWLLAAALLANSLSAQRAWTWEELREKFQASNPSLQAAQLGVEETRAQEITAYLRPNPEVTTTVDQFDPFTPAPYRPFSNLLPLVSASYLHERGHKRELRLASARQGTDIASSESEDFARTLLFNLRTAFVQALQAKAVLNVAQENLAYYDRLLGVSNDRFRAGDIAQIDMTRLELQRVQFETDVRSAEVNVRTAKIQLLALLNDRSPVDQFDVAGPFEYREPAMAVEELHRIALAARPDLRAAEQSIDKAKTDYRLAVANASTDPTFSFDLGRNPPIPAYMGFSVNIPLRIFDRNQGERARTQLEIRRSEQLHTAAETQVFSDVDSAFATLNNDLALLRPYKSKYLDLAAKVRETVSFSYQHGGSSLVDFLQAQNEYRSVQLNYVNLVGAFLTAASQLNLAVGREVIQ